MGTRKPPTPEEVAQALKEMPTSTSTYGWPTHRNKTDGGRPFFHLTLIGADQIDAFANSLPDKE